MKAVDFFKCLSDETRLRCLSLVLRRDELCVCELAHALDLSQPKISRHLALLRAHGLLQDRRHGAWVYYRVHPGLPEWARAVLQDVSTATAADARFVEDEERLQAMPNRPGASGCCAEPVDASPNPISISEPQEKPA